MIESYGAPTSKTPGFKGQLYRDLETNKFYECTGVDVARDQQAFVSTTDYVASENMYSWVEKGGEEEKAMVDGMIDRSITKVESNAPSIGSDAFSGCSKLVTAIFYNATKVGNGAFKTTAKLDTAVFYKAATIGSAVFESSGIKTLDIHTAYICEEKNAFSYSTSLQTLILRANQVCGYLGRLGYVSTPYGDELCPIEKGTGYIYVPSSVVDAYKSDSEWGRYTTQFRPLEDYTVDGTIAGELDESKI